MSITSPAWKVDDFNSDMHRLSALMNVICQLQFDRRADEVVPHVDELLWIAREIADGLTAHHDGTFVRLVGSNRNG
ncbi:MAG: hypothetical protein J0I98_04995 [Mesorhizobium sp.]|nr:hypothetical protein [Mesorhizobium sp.]MBN9242130.1 hypothetical protein [Mesorhizobium sp.]